MKELKPRERLLQAADDLFYREGIHTVGVDRILEHAGVAKGSLYGTFGGKEELVRAYIERRAETVESRVEKAVAEASTPREKIRAVFDSFGVRIAEGQYYGCPFIRACAETPLETNAATQVSSKHRAWRIELFTRLAEEVGSREPKVLARQLSMLYDGAAVAAGMDGDASAAEAARDAALRLLETKKK